MTYQDYFRNSDFEDIWTILSGFYMEHEDMKPLYSSLVETIKSLPVMPEYSEPTIQSTNFRTLFIPNIIHYMISVALLICRSFLVLNFAKCKLIYNFEMS